MSDQIGMPPPSPEPPVTPPSSDPASPSPAPSPAPPPSVPTEKKPGSGCLPGCLIVIGAIVVIGVIVGIASAVGGSHKQPYDGNNKYEAIAQCEARIESLLKAPATAKFNSDATGYGTWTVTGTVDAENSFGALIRSDYQCTVIIKGDTATTTVDYFE